ncbi:hypothetical protein AB0K48_16290 [Nonomuraea sp. NPDC055795]
MRDDTVAPPPLRGRHALLADVAIDLVAREGMRALTHRGLDAAAGMPPGTTSAYFRTREALVTGLVRRIAELDRAQLDAGRQGLREHADLETAATATAAFVDHWLSAGRNRALARYQCLLETIQYPRLRAILTPHEEAAREQVRAFLERAGAPDPRARARDYVACVDGLIFDRLMGGADAPEPGTAAARAELAATIRRLLEAAIHG